MCVGSFFFIHKKIFRYKQMIVLLWQALRKIMKLRQTISQSVYVQLCVRGSIGCVQVRLSLQTEDGRILDMNYISNTP